MTQVNRRGFLKLAGAGTAAAAAAAATAIPAVEVLFGRRAGTVAIRAVGGVPSKPLPSYATYVLDGYIDLDRKTGTLTRTVFAGHPEGMSSVALPGLSRTMNITNMIESGNVIELSGAVVDHSQLSPGESPDISVLVDRDGGVAWVQLGAGKIQLKLQA